DPARSPRGRLAGDLFVGVHSGGVRSDRTMYGPVAGRRGAGGYVAAARAPSGSMPACSPPPCGRGCRRDATSYRVAVRGLHTRALRVDPVTTSEDDRDCTEGRSRRACEERGGSSGQGSGTVLQSIGWYGPAEPLLKKSPSVSNLI